MNSVDKMQQTMNDLRITADELGYKMAAEFHDKGKGESNYCFVHPETDEGFLIQINHNLGVCLWTYHSDDSSVQKSSEKLDQLKTYLKSRNELFESQKIRGICKSCHKEKEVDSNGICYDC